MNTSKKLITLGIVIVLLSIGIPYTLASIKARQASTDADIQISMIPIPSTAQTTKAIPTNTEICLFRMPEVETNWPVDTAIWEWNKNNTNLFVEGRLSLKCAGKVVLSEVSGVAWWGRTHFLGNNTIAVYFSDSVPTEFRQSVVCHELGHVLGAAHAQGQTCMAEGSTHPVPLPNEISEAGKNVWLDSVASRQAHR